MKARPGARRWERLCRRARNEIYPAGVAGDRGRKEKWMILTGLRELGGKKGKGKKGLPFSDSRRRTLLTLAGETRMKRPRFSPGERTGRNVEIEGGRKKASPSYFLLKHLRPERKKKKEEDISRRKGRRRETFFLVDQRGLCLPLNSAKKRV